MTATNKIESMKKDRDEIYEEVINEIKDLLKKIREKEASGQAYLESAQLLFENYHATHEERRVLFEKIEKLHEKREYLLTQY